MRYGDALVFREEIGGGGCGEGLHAGNGLQERVRHGGGEGQGGEERIPSVRRILGPGGGETVHRENGIRFVFDPERVMFSPPGNVNIRVWASRLDAWGGCTVLDMFSGIGYFTLPVAKYGDPERVIAVDINPMALDYLRKSAAASGIRTGIETVARDCRELQGIKADLILMGNFKSVAYLPAALRNMGGVARIFMHYLVDTSSLGSHATMVMGRLRSYGFVGGEELHSEVVKSFAPHLWHVAALFRVRRTTGPLP
ncbi:methyltransferase domain-containing protein [Thermogymnomonas acidicola]|uniref:methyltransferase domain-containing protein n=1 Tax=Thermogymnomonas acidicola TaxID=399579 RepID=UPI001494D545|nr:methyltransferase domain-containing protein [Thermogymnomonas acidicola]